MNTHISAILEAGNTKFGKKVVIYHMITFFILGATPTTSVNRSFAVIRKSIYVFFCLLSVRKRSAEYNIEGFCETGQQTTRLIL